MKTLPLISVGMPVKNGMPFLKKSLHNIIEQTYSNIEIIISNNCSTDKTQEYLSKVNFKGRKFKIFNQKNQLSALANFDFVKRKSIGKYFIWCAHDDLRDKCQFQILVDNLEKNKKTILCFSDVYTSEKFSRNYKKITFDFQTQNLNILQRLSKSSIQKCYHFYGMWKLKDLEKIPMYYNPGWPDLPILLGASLLGDFLYVPKANFYYLEIKKTEAYRASYQDNINYKINKISKITKFLIVSLKIGYKLKKIRGALLMNFFALKKLFSILIIIFKKKLRST